MSDCSRTKKFREETNPVIVVVVFFAVRRITIAFPSKPSSSRAKSLAMPAPPFLLRSANMSPRMSSRDSPVGFRSASELKSKLNGEEGDAGRGRGGGGGGDADDCCRGLVLVAD